MSISEIIYTLLIRPLRVFFELVFITANKVIGNPGLSIIALSLAINFLVLPLYKRADAVQEEERDIEAKLHDGIAHIKKTFKGDERMMMLQTYYRQNDYRPTDVFKGSISLFLEIPFFIAAYQFLSNLWILKGVSFGIISDLGAPDNLIKIGALGINLLPILMTGINLISCAIFTKGYPLKTKVQLYSMAVFFLIFLYDSPSGLVFYWTLNNLFSLIKTIFYKLKNPRKVLSILFAAIGAVAFVYGVLFYQSEHIKHKILIIVLGVCCMIPFFIMLLKKKKSDVVRLSKDKPNARLFWAGAFYMVVLVGLVIPSAVIKSSPQEFVDLNYYVNPLWYVVSSLCLATGAFVIWMGVFYWLAGKEFRPFFDKLIVVVSGVATVDYMFFGNKLGTLTADLEYEEGFEFLLSEKLINVLIVAIVVLIFILLVKKLPKLTASVISVAALALAVMAGSNMLNIQKSISQLSGAVADAQADRPSFNLSRNGKNVIVIMLDRAMNAYIPYIMNEKPELREVYSGFTYYSNTISFGPCTNFGAAPIFGGYEYTPEEMNKRDTELLVDKQNEALKVMPVLFDENDYDVTVIEPPYAGYQWTPDLSIYDEYPDIKAYHANGKFIPAEQKESSIERRKEDFFCYSLMKASPLVVQNSLYNSGNYNNYADPSIPGKQKRHGFHEATGILAKCMDSYTVLENLSDITTVTDEGNTFLMMANDTTHEPMLMQEPEYVPAANIDNNEYDEDHADRFTLNGEELHFKKSWTLAHYETNMAALLRIGEWLQYLKDEGVYDNTRIIITADHARGLGQLDNLVLDDGSNFLLDAEFYYPLLLVKDFGAEGELTTCEDFMTNADTPTIAVSDIIDNPVNPFTGKEINNNEKYAHDQYVLASHQNDVSVNCGTQFLPDMWLAVHDDMRKKENWKILTEKDVMPY
ncbi:YidC/Oxa1 family membrane protein insertase [Butyrivibrio sp. AC2005]|uniref:YidC/Oxa1 family membrane protein insertase n=1 Tax=Butyrivibrio sp. AC2005 TaxID=1280672 RepID=UPI000410A241|nr:YidC/Oxa1 family membrane protein insertase [Butyrivibrio sp. AC2005]